MKSLLILFTILSSSYYVVAQCGSSTSVPTSATNNFRSSPFSTSTISSSTYLNNISNQTYQNTSLLAYQNIQGSPFLMDEAVNGVLVLNDLSEMIDVPINIDLYTHQIIATKPNGDIIALDGRFYKEVRLQQEGEEIVFQKANENQPNKFYQVLYQDGDMAFLKDHVVTMREGSNNGYKNEDDKFSRRTNYFIKYGEDEIAKVKLKKKDIFPLIPDSELYAMQEYAQKKGIKLNSEMNFIAFFEGSKE